MSPAHTSEAADRTDSMAGVELPEHLTACLSGMQPFIGDWLASKGLPANLREATEYALFGGGKRLRPMLVLHSCAAVGGPVQAGLPSAAAVEMIHSFSLVHDDLPALDNDDLRRGRPTVHKKFGESMAVLVGDGLMSMAFQVLAEHHEPSTAGLLCRELAEGSTAMIAGQVLDTLGGFASGLSDPDRLELIHRNKTGALLRASCRMGALAASPGIGRDDPELLDSLTRFGESVGLMFQIVDDLLDVLQTAERAGKKTGKDREAGKLTYPDLLGIDASQAAIGRLHDHARKAIEPFGKKASGLADLCDFLAVRTT